MVTVLDVPENFQNVCIEVLSKVVAYKNGFC